MKKLSLSFAITFFLGLINFQLVSAQNDPPPPKPTPTPVVRLSSILAKNPELLADASVSRERREQAFLKLMEGQRYLWGMSRTRSQSAINTSAKLARQSFVNAVELDPKLSEGYTALAELTLTTPPNDIEEAVSLAAISTKINPDNFGSQRILARIYTIKSRLNNGKLEQANAAKAIQAWKDVARIDTRNAEAWAFLSEFYAQTGKDSERIIALQNWLGASQPIENETGFFRNVTGNQSLSPESATVKLGEAYIKAGKDTEAVEVLSRAIADNPESSEAINLLSRAIPNVDKATSNKTIEALQQAVFANPESSELVQLLARLQAQAGKTDESVKLIKSLIEKSSADDKYTAANLELSLAEMLLENGRDDEAISAYQDALKRREIGKTNLVTEDDVDFATTVYSKIIQTYKITDRFVEAKAVIEKARTVFGKNDLFADKQLISLLRESGKKAEALVKIRTLRKVYPTENSLLRTEALILNELGKVTQAVALFKPLIGSKSVGSPIAATEDFNNLIFISSLYSQAKRGKLAIDTANQAYTIAKSNEMKLMAKLFLSTAQEKSGDFVSAEKTLRDILQQTPENAVALNNLGYFLVERNEKLDEAITLIQKAVKIEPTNSSFLDSLGWAYFRQNKFDEAERYLKDALRRSPSSATIQEHLGDVYDKQGKADLAKNAWKRALGLSSDSEQTLQLKAKINRIK
jgi:tetratricopeptide (TPR) repeat protein